MKQELFGMILVGASCAAIGVMVDNVWVAIPVMLAIIGGIIVGDAK